MEKKPLVYSLSGDVEQLKEGDTLIVSPNFSFKKIVSGKNILIPENQQMIVFGHIVIDGNLSIDGELCLI